MKLFKKIFNNLFNRKKKKIVLSLDFNGIAKFKGFSYTVEEGKRLSSRCYTELPDFKS